MRIFSFLIILFLFSLNAIEVDLCSHFLTRTSFNLDIKEFERCVNSEKYDNYISSYIIKNQEKVKINKNNILIVKRLGKDMNSRKLFRDELRQETFKFKEWYLDLLLNTSQPLKEKMVLFWHNHFVSSLQKVRQPKLMLIQNELFRKYAFGNYKQFVHEIIKDPEMLIYLDNRVNRKSHPNENFARELLELFTIGEGYYHENDIKELARGLSGYTVNKKLEYVFRKRIHDNKTKTFMGKTGNFTADDMIDILFENKQVSIFITKKLYKEFISYDVDEVEVNKLAKIFRDSNYEISVLLDALFLSSNFQNKDNFNSMIKSPLELTVGVLRSFDFISFDKRILLRYLNKMDQSLFNPPNVKGYKGEMSWINANTLITRKDFLFKISREERVYRTSLSNDKIKNNLGLSQIKTKHKNNKKQFIKELLSNPIYQLK